MGSNDNPQDELFYALNLDEIVPQDHLRRTEVPIWRPMPAGIDKLPHDC